MLTEISLPQMANATKQGPLQDALNLNEGHSTPSLSKELAEAATERPSEVHKQATRGGAVNLYSSESSQSSGNENSKIKNKTRPSSAFAASAMKPVAKRPAPSPYPRSKPPPPPPPSNSKSPEVKDKQKKKKIQRNTGPIQLTGTLEPVTNQTVGTRWAIKGSWRFAEEPIENADSRQTFELVSEAMDTSISREPMSGFYSGHFLFKELKTTLNGKTSTKITTISEKSVKLEFKKIKGKFSVSGFGTNALGGDFSLNGKTKPISRGQFSRSFAVHLRKIYTDLSASVVTVRSNKNKPNATLPSPSTQSKLASSPSTSLQRSQNVSGPKRTATSYPNRDSPRPQKKQKKAPESDSETESEASQRDIPSVNYPMSSQLNTTGTGVDQINGKGMWHAWTRSFDKPLLALLDLFDNAVDASWTLLGDRDDPNSEIQKPKIRVDIDRYGRNGVVMRNASTFIPPLQQVLQVYKSSKAGEGDNSIGENGIGVKHACASLSGLSFVFTKTTDPSDGSCTLSMGILMQELQRDDGIVLPSMAFPVGASRNGSLDEVQEALERHCEENPDTWGKAVKEYGDDHFGDGIERCLRHMDHLRGDNNWRDSENVFAVVLANLKHAAFDDDEEDGSEMEVIRVDGIERDSTMAQRNANGTSTTKYHTVHQSGDTDVDEDLQRSLSLLNTLKAQLPYLYLHLHDLDICVEKQPIESIYWERRLTELSKFELQLPQTEHWSKPKKVRGGEVKTGNETNEVFNITKPEETIRFFCGFDPYRCKNKQSRGAKKSADSSDDEAAMSVVPGEINNGGRLNLQGNNAALKVYLYSRQSGRLIKVQNDPRNELRLISGSTDFCQGLTVIIDDHYGTLPLNPTKQDTAYGHSKHGQTHKENLQEWTAAISDFYWKYYFEQLFGSSKKEMSDAVANSRANLETAYKDYRTSQRDITPLCRGRFITYRNVEFRLGTRSGKGTRIRTRGHSRRGVELEVDQQSLISRLERDPEFQEKRGLETADTTSRKKMTEMRLEQQQLEVNVLRTTKEHLTAQLLQFQEYIARLEAENKNLTDETLILKNDLQKRDQTRSRDEQEIHLLKKEKERLENECKEQTSRAEKWKQTAMQRDRQLKEVKQDASVGSPQPSQQPPSTPTTDSKGERGDVDNLIRQIKIYKQNDAFYKSDSEGKKRQIAALTEEKTRFENRIQELEEAQLALDSYGDNSELQF